MFPYFQDRLRRAILPAWKDRLTSMLDESQSARIRAMTPEQAYLEGTRTGYWDALVDAVALGLLHLPVFQGDDAMMDEAH